MLDVESLGATSDAPIIAMGAVNFDISTGETGPEFYRRINWDSAIKGRRVSGDTIKWWMKQSAEALAEVLDPANEASFAVVLHELSAWFRNLGRGNIYVWGNGSSFDISMLEHALVQHGFTIPWKFYNIRDCRTIQMLAEGLIDRHDVKFEGDKHNALHDARWQAAYTSAMWVAIKQFTPTIIGEPKTAEVPKIPWHDDKHPLGMELKNIYEGVFEELGESKDGYKKIFG
jgi:exodeoxyribonuclease VIII